MRLTVENSYHYYLFYKNIAKPKFEFKLIFIILTNIIYVKGVKSG